jgi:predicted amidohydrolase
MKCYPTAAIALAVVSFVGLAARNDCSAQETAEPGSRYVRIGHFQCRCQQGDFEANLQTVVQGLTLAAEANLDIVSFPESFLSGYFRREADARANCFAMDSPQMQQVLKRTSHFKSLFMVGFNELRDDQLYNTVAVIEQGRVLGRYSKAFPCIGYFKPGKEFPVFEKKGLKFGVIICADGGYIEPARILAIKGATMVFAPHFNFVSDPIQHYQMVRNDHVARAIENGVYFLRANNFEPARRLKGLNDTGPSYGYGDSYLLDPNGQVVAGAGLYDEYLMIYNLNLDKKYRNRHTGRSVKSAIHLNDELLRAMEATKTR